LIFSDGVATGDEAGPAEGIPKERGGASFHSASEEKLSGDDQK